MKDEPLSGPRGRLNPWRYSQALRVRMADWVNDSATPDDIVKIATNISPAWVVDPDAYTSAGAASDDKEQSL